MSEIVARRFSAPLGDLPGADVPWLNELRVRSADQFERDGFPSRRVEEWKYADLSSLQETDLAPARPSGANLADVVAGLALPAESHRLVFVNGRLSVDLSAIAALPDGAVLETFANVAESNPEGLRSVLSDPTSLLESRLSGRDDQRPFALAALNTAFATDGYILRLAPGAAVEWPIHVIFIASEVGPEAAIQPRNVILAGAGASALVVETYAAASSRGYFTNALTEVKADRDANIRHYRVQDEAHDASHVGTILAELGHASAYDSFVLATGGGYARNEIRASLVGDHVHCRLNGACLARGSQRLDTWTRVDMTRPNGTLHETYRCVVDDKARTAFQGRIRVSEKAEKADAHQANNNLLLSEDAQADSKPELEILTDDVRCSHGATVGDIDENALFYLRARGVDLAAARNLLIEAFVGDVIDHVGYGTAHDYLRAAFARWLDSRREDA